MSDVGGPPRAAQRTTRRATASVAACLAVGLSAAWLPADAASAKTHPPKPTKVVVTKDNAAVHKGSAISGTSWGDNAGSGEAVSSSGQWLPQADHGSLFSITAADGAQAAWAHGITGKGVTVAVIDTGIAPVPGLDDGDKVVNGPDLSFDGQAPGSRYVDGYGHGTHMAGIIAGRDAGFKPKAPTPSTFDGVAPDAQLLNMKVGASDGGADVSQVIAALDWVVAHRKDHGMNVRVVNLAYGTESVQPWQVDPLARAVENAWNHGLVVVTAAGNDGLRATSLLMPAVDPHVLAVGAVDNVATTTTADDVVAAFTSGGSAQRHPDVLTPGRSVVSLRVPGSYVDTMHPEGLVSGDASGRFFRGSGTSQATAVASGEIALLLQARPTLTPDQVKALLRSTADPLVRDPQPAMGAGVTDLGKALSAPAPAAGPTPPGSSGAGSLEASRGGEHVVDPANGVALSGEVDAMGSPWHGTAWAAASAAGTSWSGGSWNGRVWTGKRWGQDGWAAAAWTGTSWSGIDWSAQPWSDATWEARGWRDTDWSARSWRQESWSARGWRSLP